MSEADTIRLLLAGTPGSEFRLAAEMARTAGAEVTLADTGDEALDLLRTDSAALVMIDVALDVPRFMAQLRAERFAVPVLACGIDASASQAVAAIRAGARDYVPLPPEQELIAAAITSLVPQATPRMMGNDPVLHRAIAYGLAMARSRAPVLLGGEPGTGKAVMARAIHDASGRSGPFLTVECAGVSPEVIDAELFGHEGGAFPGAVARRLGRLEKAGEGTLFLRDVDCLPPAAQTRLLAALRDGVVRRLGGTEMLPITARLIVSASHDLEARVTEGAFRADLLARLALVRVTMPPLRERRSDIPLLAGAFAEQLAATNGLPARPFTDEALELLSGYAWPCNVRELEDVVHRAVLLARGHMLDAASIVLMDGSHLAPSSCSASGPRPDIDKLIGRTVEEVERELILQTLEHCRGNRTSASGILGISVRTMRNKLKSFLEAGIPVSPAL